MPLKLRWREGAEGGVGCERSELWREWVVEGVGYAGSGWWRGWAIGRISS